MQVKKINIKNLGQLSTYECEIEKDVLLVTQKDYADLLLGLSYASCNILFYMIRFIYIKIFIKEHLNED